MRRIALAVLLLVGDAGPAGAFARGTVRVDVRDASGKPAVVAKVTLRADDGAVHEAARIGDIYVADGLVAGTYTVELDGAPDWQGARTVAVKERRQSSVVAVLGGATGRRRKARGEPAGVMRGDEPGCDDPTGEAVTPVARQKGLPAAGRVEIRVGRGKGQGKLVCVEALAGGVADLRLKPGDYLVDASFVGGARVHAYYRIVPRRPAPPLQLGQ